MNGVKQFCKFIALLAVVHEAHAAATYLQAKQYLDVNSGSFIKPANLLIENGMITAINPAEVPPDAVVIKKPDLTLLPGLMDVHVHLPIDYGPKYALQHVQDDAAMSTVRGAKNAQAILMAGFTTVRNLGQIYPGESFVDVALAKASESKWIVAPHIVPAGHAISITGGHLDPDMIGAYAPEVLPVNYRVGVADGVPEVVKAVRYQIKHGAKVIKVAATAGILSDEESAGDQQFTYEELKAIVDEANRHHIAVAAHAHGSEGINAAIVAGVRSIEHGSLISAEGIRLMRQRGTYLVPTPYVSDALNLENLNPLTRKKAEYIKPLAQAHLSEAIKAGVKIAYGTDSGVYPHGENAKQFALLVKRGMTPLDAIRSATINAADLLRLSDRGQIKNGYHADIIGVTQNPIENIQALESVDFVMKDGDVVKG